MYAEQYRVEMSGGQTASEVDKKTSALTQLFAKILYQLDSLSHQRVLFKPLKQKEEGSMNVEAIAVEDTM